MWTEDLNALPEELEGLRLETEMWRDLKAELGSKVSIDFGFRRDEEEAFWAKWDAGVVI